MAAALLRNGSGGIGDLWSPAERHCFALLRNIPSSPTTTTTAAAAASSPLFKVHAFLLRRGVLDANLSLLTLLISGFSDLAAAVPPITASALLRHARCLFNCRASQDSFLCNTMIRALVNHRLPHEALSLYRDLLREAGGARILPPFSPDSYTFTFLLKSIAGHYMDASPRGEGPQLHTHVIKMGFCYHDFASTGLVDMYAKAGEMVSARKLFDEMPHRSPHSWTSMSVGYARIGDTGTALELFRCMPEKDTAAFNAMIDVLVKMGDIAYARRLFDDMVERNVVSWTSLISGYCKVGNMQEARELFQKMPEKNLYSWNVMIGGYCQNRQSHCALELFRELQSSSSLPKPDDVTLVSILPAVADMGAIDLGRWIHNYARRKGFDQVVTVSTALVDMYSKCGDISEARRVFNSIKIKEPASWNAMINGLALNGQPQEALDLFMEMQGSGACPNEVTMIGVLSACSHGGLVEEGRRWFREMEALGVVKRIEHYGCMVDLLGRSGYLDEAERLIEDMPCGANGIIMSSLLSSCVCFGDIERAERILRRVTEVEPGNVMNYVMMRNLYACAKRWGDVGRMKEIVRIFGGKREAGCSVIEVASRVWEFVSGDGAHPESEFIYEFLRQLHLQMKEQKVNEWELDLTSSHLAV